MSEIRLRALAFLKGVDHRLKLLHAADRYNQITVRRASDVFWRAAEELPDLVNDIRFAEIGDEFPVVDLMQWVAQRTADDSELTMEVGRVVERSRGLPDWVDNRSAYYTDPQNRDVITGRIAIKVEREFDRVSTDGDALSRAFRLGVNWHERGANLAAGIVEVAGYLQKDPSGILGRRATTTKALREKVLGSISRRL